MKNHNWPLIIGIAIPFIFILIFAAFIYLPQISIHPQYDFLYTMNDQYDYDHVYLNKYKVQDGKLTVYPISYNESLNFKSTVSDYPELYMYNMEEDTINIISLEDAQQLSLDAGPSSPDGYIVDYNYGHDGIFELFGDSNNNGYYIGDEKAQKKLAGMGSNGRYYRDFVFIGWIIK